MMVYGPDTVPEAERRGICRQSPMLQQHEGRVVTRSWSAHFTKAQATALARINAVLCLCEIRSSASAPICIFLRVSRSSSAISGGSPVVRRTSLIGRFSRSQLPSETGVWNSAIVPDTSKLPRCLHTAGAARCLCMQNHHLDPATSGCEHVLDGAPNLAQARVFVLVIRIFGRCNFHAPNISA